MISLPESIKRFLNRLAVPAENQIEQAALWSGELAQIEGLVTEANVEYETAGLKFELVDRVPKVTDIGSQRANFEFATIPFRDNETIIYGLRRDKIRDDQVIESQLIAFFLMLPEFPQMLFVLDKASFNNLMVILNPLEAVRSAPVNPVRQ